MSLQHSDWRFMAGQRLSAWFIGPTLSPHLAGSAEGR